MRIIKDIFERIARLWARLGQTACARELKAHGLWYAALAALLMLLGLGSHAYRVQYARPTEPIRAEAPEVVPVQANLWERFDTPLATPEPTRWVWPLEGEIIGAFAPDSLVWSQTLGQWQTHPALDILGSPGEAVCACADGTVADAYRDSLWGNVVVIEHPDGGVSTYANLNTLSMAQVGEAVRAGDVIGSVGQSAPCEAELPWHLHFAYERDGERVDFAALVESARLN